MKVSQSAIVLLFGMYLLLIEENWVWFHKQPGIISLTASECLTNQIQSIRVAETISRYKRGRMKGMFGGKVHSPLGPPNNVFILGFGKKRGRKP